MSDSNKKEIIIDLSASSNAKKYSNKDIIQQRELVQAKALIDDRLNREDKDVRYNDTISIIGSRGSGKTSFILSLLNEYSNHKDIQVLPVIDPTLIEEKGHIFLVIISLIQNLITQKLGTSDCDPHSDKYIKTNKWKERLRKLTAGFPTLDGVGGQSLNESNWQDSEYVMDKGLIAVNSAYELEKSFNSLVSLALDILNKKAFMITLDDIDVDFRKGWPVLETIRKYLTSNQLIVLVSGDLQLFSKAIRKQQWKNFGKAILKNETESFYEADQDAKDKKRALGELITEMESQYLQKVLKPKNRIHLTTLYDKIKLYEDNLKVKLRNEQMEIMDLMDYYKTILKLMGIHNKYQSESYSSFLLNLPIRTQIQFLQNFQGLKLNDNINLTDAFLSDLYEEEVDIQLATNLPKMLNVVILKLLLKEKNFDEAYQLQPTTSKQSLNSSLMSLSFLFSKHVTKNPFLIFDYIVKIGYLRNLLTILDYQEITDSTFSKPTIEGLCRHSGILQDKVLRDILGNINAYIESIRTNKDRKNNDVIYLYGAFTKNKGSIEESKDRIDYVFSSKREKITTQDQTLAFIPITTSSFLHYRSSSTVYSIYTLISTIGELLKKYELNDLDNGFIELSQWRTYPMISFDKGFTSLSDVEDYLGVDIKIDEIGNSKIKDLFEKWCEKYSKVDVCSPHLIGKIATRIYYSVNSIANDSKSSENLGIAMHRRIIALMNAILVEDIREHSHTTNGLDISNAVTSDKVFIENISFALKQLKEEKLSISRWLLSCPMFLFYLDKSFLQSNDFVSFTGLSNINDISDSSIYDLLCLVNLKDKKKSTLNSNNEIEEKKPMIRSARLTERNKVIETLIANKIPYTLFESDEDVVIQRRLNNDVRNMCKDLFDEEELKSDYLRDFRRYVNDNKDRNDLIQKWIQTQS